MTSRKDKRVSRKERRKKGRSKKEGTGEGRRKDEEREGQRTIGGNKGTREARKKRTQRLTDAPEGFSTNAALALSKVWHRMDKMAYGGKEIK